ncbi:MAG TPA: trypsin-like peptidase domain-containing protein, partial [Thermoanaerobaculia bacterium]|nr:trypsin-like peptidase domain-containing protein [Thermoanaerobaculia bacterium]
ARGDPVDRLAIMRPVPRARAVIAALFVACFLTACQKSAPSLDPVQRLSYGARPAVVRVRAYATAKFSAPPAALADAHRDIVAQGLARPAAPPRDAASIDTGAGGSGSGFVVHPDGFILTSGHVVSLIRDPAAVQRDLLANGAIALLLARYPIDVLRSLHRASALVPLVERLAGRGTLRDVRTFREVDLSNGDRAAFSILEFSPSLAEKGDDVALLRIDRHDLPILPLGDSDAVHVQDPIWVIGYPSVASTSDELIGGWLSQETDLEATVNSGSITSIKRNVANLPVFQTEVPLYPGNSGGPAVDRDGRVIGIATWGHATAAAIKFLVPIRVATPYLARRRVDLSEKGSFTTAYATALEAAEAGDWRDALVGLRKANDVFPGNPDVARLTRDAEAAVRMLPFWRNRVGGTTLAALAIGAALLALVLVIRYLRRPADAPRRPYPSARTRPDAATSPAPPEPEPTLVVPLRTASEGGVLGRLTILNGPRAGEQIGLGGSGIRIGREPAVCEIVLDDPKISRLHAEIVELEGRVLLIDRKSSNGTWVNDTRVDRHVLTDGDIIYFGGRSAVAAAFHG